MGDIFPRRPFLTVLICVFSGETVSDRTVLYRLLLSFYPFLGGIVRPFPLRLCLFGGPFLHFFLLFLPGSPFSQAGYSSGIIGDVAHAGGVG